MEEARLLEEMIRINERRERIDQNTTLQSIVRNSAAESFQVPLDWDYHLVQDMLTRWQNELELDLCAARVHHNPLMPHLNWGDRVAKSGQPAVNVVFQKMEARIRVLATRTRGSESHVDLAIEKERCVKHEQRIAALERERADFQNTCQQLRTEVARLAERRDQAESQLQKAGQERAGLQDACQRLCGEAARSAERCDQTEKQLQKVEQERAGLQESCQKLRAENACLRERCDQRAEQLQGTQRENASLKGELADLRSILCNTLKGETLSGAGVFDASMLGWQVPHDAVAAGIAESASKESHHSFASWSFVSVASGPDCFVIDWLFKAVSGGSAESIFYLPGSLLAKGSQVLAHDDTLLEVACAPEEHEADEVIELRAGGALLRVTPEHRVPALRGDGGSFGDVPAKDLCAGDRVYVDGEPVELTSTTPISDKVQVLKITFKPDKPVAVFTPPPKILSKGHASSKMPIRRGGMNRRGQPGGSGDAHGSIPDTAGTDAQLPEVCMAYHPPQR